MSCNDKTIKTLGVAERAFNKASLIHTFSHYTGTVTLHGMARLCEHDKVGGKLSELKSVLEPYITNGIEYGNFESYHCGGNATSWLLFKGLLPESEKIVYACADKLYQKHPKTSEGIFSYPDPVKAKEGKVWIDVAFAVCPFLLYAGLYFSKTEWIDEAYDQIKLPYDMLLDPECGLLHQSRGFCGKDCLSRDHWSRGNGWGILALTELAANFPKDSPQYESIIDMYKNLIEASLKYQDENGLWHQEMTRMDSYVETSGSGLILYAIGSAIENGMAKPEWKEAFEKGIKGYMSYVALDGSVHNTCRGCLCPGQGTIEDYMAMPCPVNDAHSHGPVVLAYAQAARIGINELSL